MDAVSILTYEDESEVSESTMRLYRTIIFRLQRICRFLKLKYPALTFDIAKFGGISVCYPTSVVQHPITLINRRLHESLAGLIRDKTIEAFEEFKLLDILTAFDYAQAWTDTKEDERIIFTDKSVSPRSPSCYTINDLDSFLRHVSEI